MQALQHSSGYGYLLHVLSKAVQPKVKGLGQLLVDSLSWECWYRCREDVSVSNCEDAKAVLTEEHKAEGVNKLHPIALVLLCKDCHRIFTTADVDISQHLYKHSQMQYVTMNPWKQFAAAIHHIRCPQKIPHEIMILLVEAINLALFRDESHTILIIVEISIPPF